MPDNPADSTHNNAALIVGGGLSGMQSALLLAESGHRVYLVDSAPGIGGSLHLLDRTFPTDSCGLCISSPVNPTLCPSLECSMHPNITPLPLSELVALEGNPGQFRATVREHPRYVNVELCNLCGDCFDVCPVTRPHPYEGNLAPQKAIYAPPPRAVPNAYAIDMDVCIRCGKCVDACTPGAIDLNAQGSEQTLEVGAVLLAPGYAPFDARRKSEFGFGILSNVVTSLQFERMTSTPGSTKGRLVRPSDGSQPKRIAFIQCVGSRDQIVHREYCSSVCCMYTAKQASAVREIQPDAQVTVFTMDIRTFGKGYERYWARVQADEGIEFRRAMVSSVRQHPQTGELTLTYTTEDGRPAEETCDLLVLSVGFDAPDSARELAERAGININEYGFGQWSEWHPVSTSRPGVLMAGCYQEPKDIPDTVADAAAAAAEAARFLSPVSAEKTSAAPKEKRGEEEPSVGIYICSCDDTLAETLDMTDLQAHAEGLRRVAAVKVGKHACDQEGPGELARWVEQTNIHRLVFAGCSQRLIQAPLEAALEQGGGGTVPVQYANIREGCAWVHRDLPMAATIKARDSIAMAAIRALDQQPLQTEFADVEASVLVIGGGLAGMTAALTLAEIERPVTLIEREAELGGQLFNVGFTPETADPVQHARKLARQVESHPLISVHKSAELQALSGTGGNFQATIRPIEGETIQTHHGAIIVATGGHEATVSEYLYGDDSRVLLQGDLSRALAQGDDGLAGTPLADASSIVMIQCAGSRDEARPYCSRICCTQAVKNAIRIKELRPDADIFILYRDIRTFGFRELMYRKARDLGVVFLRYDLPNKPSVEVADTGNLSVAVYEAITGQKVGIPADAVVLSTGIAPNENQTLAQALDVPLDADGFFQEQHPKMRPLNFAKPGIYLCGLAHGPHFIPETIAQAKGAAMRAAAYLSQSPRPSKPTRVTVNARLCSFCGLCVSACPYGARIMDYEQRVAQVLHEICQGCGICAVTCPNKATQQHDFEHKSVLAEVDTATLGV